MIFQINCMLAVLWVSTDIIAQSNPPTNIPLYHFRVEGNMDGWQSSGIQVKKGDYVLYAVEGKVSYGRTIKEADAYGFAAPILASLYNRPEFPKLRHGILICRNFGEFSVAIPSNVLRANARNTQKVIPSTFDPIIAANGFVGNYFVSAYDQELSFIINDKKTSDNSGAFDISIYVIPGCPDLNGSYDLASLVSRSNGELDFCLKDNCAGKLQSDGSFWADGRNASGHYYLAINPIGHSSMSAATAFTILTRNIYDIFPGGAIDQATKDPSSTMVQLNHIYALTNVRFWLSLAPPPGNILGTLPNPLVKAINLTPYYFTFEATGIHPLKGTAIHGVCKDKCGDLYLFQQGKGLPGEGRILANGNLVLAEQMWSMMAENMKNFLN